MDDLTWVLQRVRFMYLEVYLGILVWNMGSPSTVPVLDFTGVAGGEEGRGRGRQVSRYNGREGY